MTTTVKGKANKGGRPEGTFKGGTAHTRNFSIRLTKDERKVLQHCQEQLDHPASDILRGLIHSLKVPQRTKSHVKVTVNNMPMLITREEGKNLLKELTEVLL